MFPCGNERSNIFTGYKKCDEEAEQVKALIASRIDRVKYVKSEMGVLLKHIQKHLPSDVELKGDIKKDLTILIVKSVEPLKKYFTLTPGFETK